MGFHLHDVLVEINQVRLDDLQMFVGRDEEDALVVSMHFPQTNGVARQVKIAADIREFNRSDGVRDVRVFDEQALIDFEQLLTNFIVAALPVLRQSAYLLSQAKCDRPSPPQPKPKPPKWRDGKEDFIVNSGGGWPIQRPRFRLHDVVRLDPGQVMRDVDSGYLVRVNSLPQSDMAIGTAFGNAIAACKERREREALNRKVRTPTDVDALFATSDGRKLREHIVATFEKIVDDMFPARRGPGLARTNAETAALVAELRDKCNFLRAEHILAGKKVSLKETYAEMAEQGPHGPKSEFLTAPNIEYLIGRGDKPSRRSSKPKTTNRRRR